MSDNETRTYDVVVIGAGPVGENVADRTSAAGLRTVIVETELVGGECSYWACEPSKALLRPALLYREAARFPGVASAVTGRIDAAAVLKHRDRMAAEWNDEDQLAWLDSVGVDLVRGHGRLDGPRRVTVRTPEGGTVHLDARHAVAVCTGTSAASPPLPDLDTLRPWTSREATAAQSVPDRLAILGGGVVAVEMATAWQALGARVTLIAREPRLLERVEPFAADLVADRLREVGVDLRLGTTIAAARREAGGVRLVLADGAQLVADELLSATGRVPRTADLGIDTVGLTPGDWLTTDDTLTVPGIEGQWLYAVGDVNRRALLTHQGKYQARIAGAVIAARARGQELDTGRWGRHAATADSDAVPQVVFTDPEIAAVGLTTAEAARAGRAGRAVDVVDYEIGHVAGAVQHDPGYRGRARVLIDPARGVVVGATFAGPGVTELLHSATVAIAGEVPLERLWHAVPSFPTLGEVWLRLLETYRDQREPPKRRGVG
ncbi:NAD(P)/FAD-dependent oxidoreductase [Nocardia neocaledoniensis]